MGRRSRLSVSVPVAARSTATDFSLRHSTSHGVGAFLNVHEGPQGVGQRPAHNETPLQAGHVISNEPGYYADGKFGIRIENVDIIKIAETRENFGGKGYLELERVTMVRFLSVAFGMEEGVG
jgi:Xaa-Pro aminopeptidase